MGNRDWIYYINWWFPFPSISVSNADSEHDFSMLRKIHTDQRANLDQSTIIALMGMKFNCDDCCCDIKVSQELLSAGKNATSLFVAPSSRAIHLNFTCYSLNKYVAKINGCGRKGVWSINSVHALNVSQYSDSQTWQPSRSFTRMAMA